MNLDELHDAIEAYTQNNDWTGPVASIGPNKDLIVSSQLNTIIRQAENKIYSLVKTPSTIKSVTGKAIAQNTGDVSGTISDFQRPIAAIMKDGGDANFSKLLLYMEPGLSGALGISIGTGTAPKYYSVVPSSTVTGEPVKLNAFPFTSSSTLTLDIDYYGFPESIVDEADGESWLGTTAENLLLYGCLVEAYTFMKGSTDLLQAYKQKFDEAVQTFNDTTQYAWESYIYED